MKSYTTIKQRADGMRYFPMQLQGAQADELADLLRGRGLIACMVPRAQAGNSAWQVILSFNGDVSLELTASSTIAHGWDELGTINIQLQPDTVAESACEWRSVALPQPFHVVRAEIVRWQGNGLVVDAGLCLRSAGDRSLLVVARGLPGALCVTLLGEVVPTSWQLPVEEYVFIPMDAG